MIDADSLCYACAAITEGQGEQLARWQTQSSIEDLLQKLNATEYRIYLTGKNNFRYNIYPEYKANRLKLKRPEYLQVCQDFLIKEWGAIVSDGCEADDLLGVGQLCEAYGETIISSIDKDLNQISGWHYNPRTNERYLVSPLDAMRFFYTQLLRGDPSDNIKGAPGIGPKKAEALLAGITDEREMFDIALSCYSGEEELEMNASCLWLWRKPDDIWKLETHRPKEV